MQLGDLGDRCKLPQRVRVEPGRQTTFGAFWSEMHALSGKALNGYCKCLLTKIANRLYQVIFVSVSHFLYHICKKNKQISPITDMWQSSPSP